jgi:nucleoside-diphosphate-sugar epimerase
MARFLVTGAAGFIGRHMVARLTKDGHEVAAVDRRPRGAGEPPAAVCQDDLLTMDLVPLLDGVDVVIHLAGQPGVRESWAQFPAYSRGNIELTQRLLEALRGRPLTKFVLASTSSVYGSAPMPAREDGPALPVSPYGATKLAAEGLCDLYGRTAGLPWVALRYFTVYGPGQRPDMAFTRWLTAARDGTPIQLYGDGEQVRDFTYVGDVVDLTLRAALSPAAQGMAINIGGGRPVPIKDALTVIGQITGVSLQVDRQPAAPGDMSATRADTARLRQTLGTIPATALAEGLERQWQWIRGGGEEA